MVWRVSFTFHVTRKLLPFILHLADILTNRVESQIGFINFVIKPAFLLLACFIPTVEKVIVSQMEMNLKYWEGNKAKAKREKEK